jgi:hypothetical protein
MLLPPPPPLPPVEPLPHEANKSENANAVVRMILLSGSLCVGGGDMTFVHCHSFLHYYKIASLYGQHEKNIA